MSDSFYDILGVNKNSTHDEIKKAFRGLSLKWHPDRNRDVNAVDKFQKINEAYETLGDLQLREDYDNSKTNLFDPNKQYNMNDIFSSIFNVNLGNTMGGFSSFQGMPGGPRIQIFRNGCPINTQDSMQKPLPIIKTIALNMQQVLCSDQIPVEIERWIIENGIKKFEKETIYVTIPKGVDDNELLTIRDKGNILNDECKGDIKIFMKIDNNTEFVRKGLDLLFNKTISLKESLCGFNFELKYINGKTYTINNNKGNIIPFNHTKTIPGMGLTREGHIGNLIIVFNIEFPKSLTEEQILKLNDIL